MMMMLVAHGRHLLSDSVMKSPLLLEPAAHLISLFLQTRQSRVNKLILQPEEKKNSLQSET